MVVVPPPTAVTTPLEVMVATPVFEDAQGVVELGVPDPVSCNVEPPTVMLCTPVMVGTAFTFTVMAVRGLSQPEALT